MSVFDHRCDFCNVDSQAEGLPLRADGNFGWICPACCRDVDEMRAEYKAANPDNPHRWRYQELPEMEKQLADRKRRWANQSRRIARARRTLTLSRTQARRILRKEVKGGIVRRLAGVGKFQIWEWNAIAKAIRQVDDMAQSAEGEVRSRLLAVRAAILRLYDPADASRIRS